MVKSIRIRLLVWYATVLTSVVVGFSLLLYFEVRAARLTELDSDLQSTAAGLEASLRLFPPHEINGENMPPPRKQHFPGKKDFPPPKWDAQDTSPRDRWLNSLRVPGPQGRPEERPPIYFLVWKADGTLLKAVDLPPGHDEVMPPGIDRPVIFFQGVYRERVERGPHGSTILVGRDSGNLPAELSAFAWRLTATGSIVLAVSLIGGWLISRRILRPIATIASTASRISGISMTERIDTTHVDAELSDLAGVLNETFDRLQAAFERQAQFTADASHELRTPLAVIRSQAELTLARTRTPEEYQLAVGACLKAANRMTDLVERLLLLARADAGSPMESRTVLSLDRVVNEVISQMRSLAAEKEVEFSTDLRQVSLLADGVAIAQVASNLIANAIHYNKVGGEVRVKVKQEENFAILSVKDSGLGIGTDDRKRIFERFYRVDKARTRPIGGTGLGLAICKSIVEAHGGAITCDSVVGSGTIFRVRLPIVEPAPHKKSE